MGACLGANSADEDIRQGQGASLLLKQGGDLAQAPASVVHQDAVPHHCIVLPVVCEGLCHGICLLAISHHGAIQITHLHDEPSNGPSVMSALGVGCAESGIAASQVSLSDHNAQQAQ